MKVIEFAARPGSTPSAHLSYRPGTALRDLGFSEQFLVWATRVIGMGKEGKQTYIRLESAFAAAETPDSFPLLQQFIGLIEIELGRPLASPCLRWRELLADEARILSLLSGFQASLSGAGVSPETQSLSTPLRLTGQRLALSLSAAGLYLVPRSQQDCDWDQSAGTSYMN